MNVLSLFDGISCGKVALDNLGIKINKYFASEIDKFAIKISNNNHKNITQIGDVTNIVCSELPKIHLLIGGSPCQGFSKLGKQLNFEDERSKLFFEFVRIKNELNPKYFLLENVCMKKEFEEIISDYIGVSPILIDSQNFSAQKRKRLSWTNISLKNNFNKSQETLFDILEKNVSDKYYLSEAYLKCFTNSKNRNGFIRSDKFKPFSDTNRKSYCLTTKAGQRVSDNYIVDERGTRRLTPIECERLQGLRDNYTEGVSDTQRYKSIGNGWNIKTIEYILSNIERDI